MLPVVILQLVIHVRPFHSWVPDVAPLGVNPPAVKAAFCEPAPEFTRTAVIRLLTLLHDVPSYASVQVISSGVPPPNTNPVFCVPAAP